MSPQQTRCKCSTPFGIQGIRTLDVFRLVRAGPVLNAFRHPRNPHTCGGCSRFSMSHCAQRLSASKESALETTTGLVYPGNKCSTPFGIQGIRTSLFHFLPSDNRGCSTPFGIQGIRTTAAKPAGDVAAECSTPFGIQGIRTGDHRRAATGRTRVLNAFRHPRNPHLGVTLRYVSSA